MPRPNDSDTHTRFITRMPDRLWRVAVEFGDLALPVVYISDKVHGGKDAALAKAIALRDRLVKTHKIPLRTYDGNGWQVSRATNTSGQVGVFLEATERAGTQVRNWTYLYQQDGKSRRLRLSIRKHGYVAAWQRLADERAKRTGHPSNPIPPNPTAELKEWALRYRVALPSGKALSEARQAWQAGDKKRYRKAMATLLA